jgi:hypothetical protein
VGQRKKALRTIQAHGGICLTTYGLMSSGNDLLNDSGEHTWDWIILDEGGMYCPG